jgi:hypothetical protein
VIAVLHCVAAVAGLDPDYLSLGQRHGTGPLRDGQIVVIETVLRPLIAADHTLTDEGAAVLQDTVSVRLWHVRLGSEAHRQVGPHRARGPIHPFDQIFHGSRPHRHLAGHRVGLDRANLNHVRCEVEVSIQAGA